MNPRLIRSLQRGGLTAKLTGSEWGVWRGRDRRHRMIGRLTGAEIDLLRLYECLHLNSSKSYLAMRWQLPDALSRACIKELMASYADSSKARSCLDQIILLHPTDTERSKLADAARAFRRDALSTGVHLPSTDQACGRLSRIVETLSERDCRFTYDLLVSRATNLTLAKSYQQHPAAIRTKAIDVLRCLSGLYV